MTASDKKDEVHRLMKDLEQAATAYADHSDDDARRELRKVALKLASCLETPVDSHDRTLFEPHRSAAIRVASDAGWLEALTHGKPLSATELAEKTGAQRSLVVRIMRLLAAEDVVAEVDTETYAATEKTMVHINWGWRDGLIHFFEHVSPVLLKLPEYFASNGYKEPEDQSHGPYPFISDGKTFWDRAVEQPILQEHFDNFMTAQRVGPNWIDICPIDEVFGPGLRNDPDAVLLIDIGGGIGHDMKYFRSKHSRLPGRLVVQDLLATIDYARQQPHEGVELQPYDMFTAQPIKGARAYYFRTVFHDWDDASCEKALQNAAAAMERGYSRILINERVLPEKGVSSLDCVVDLTMLTMAGKERTRAEWDELLGSVGLRIVKVWTVTEPTQRLMEVDLA
ncbi:MAG: hypothetical protein M1816_003682 [Peltula sp. TS41687]|nr:MAG: hypothetical protein M1816_003682 [Peltula sp. TS41687]